MTTTVEGRTLSYVTGSLTSRSLEPSQAQSDNQVVAKVEVTPDNRDPSCADPLSRLLSNLYPQCGTLTLGALPVSAMLRLDSAMDPNTANTAISYIRPSKSQLVYLSMNTGQLRSPTVNVSRHYPHGQVMCPQLAPFYYRYRRDLRWVNIDLLTKIAIQLTVYPSDVLPFVVLYIYKGLGQQTLYREGYTAQDVEVELLYNIYGYTVLVRNGNGLQTAPATNWDVFNHNPTYARWVCPVTGFTLENFQHGSCCASVEDLPEQWEDYVADPRISSRTTSIFSALYYYNGHILGPRVPAHYLAPSKPETEKSGSDDDLSSTSNPTTEEEKPDSGSDRVTPMIFAVDQAIDVGLGTNLIGSTLLTVAILLVLANITAPLTPVRIAVNLATSTAITLTALLLHGHTSAPILYYPLWSEQQ